MADHTSSSTVVPRCIFMAVLRVFVNTAARDARHNGAALRLIQPKCVVWHRRRAMRVDTP